MSGIRCPKTLRCDVFSTLTIEISVIRWALIGSEIRWASIGLLLEGSGGSAKKEEPHEYHFPEIVFIHNPPPIWMSITYVLARVI